MTIRYSWDTFPPVWIHANESAVKQHHAYHNAKSGEPDSAYLLVNSLLNPMVVEQLAMTFDKPILVSAHAIEGMGVNAIPEALADALAQNGYLCRILNKTGKINLKRSNLCKQN